MTCEVWQTFPLVSMQVEVPVSLVSVLGVCGGTESLFSAYVEVPVSIPRLDGGTGSLFSMQAELPVSILRLDGGTGSLSSV